MTVILCGTEKWEQHSANTIWGQVNNHYMESVIEDIPAAQNEITYAYDCLGNRTQMSDVSGSYTYSYDKMQRLLSVSKDGAAQISYTYNSEGAIATVSYGGSNKSFGGGGIPIMKWYTIIGIIIAGLLVIALAYGFIIWFAFGGGMVFFPNPPKPEITYEEFHFKLEYELNGAPHVLSDTIVCKFDGFNIDEGRGKTRRWKYYYKNAQNNEIFNFPQSPKFPKIVLESIDQYKIILGVGNAEYFLGEPEYAGLSGTPPFIHVYDTSTGYYKDPVERKQILDEHNFKIISWYCDPPIENSFK